MNINRLITQSGSSKVSFLHDQAVSNSAMFIGVTETWLHEGIFDAEVSHAFPGYNILRCDRSGGRLGGGVALYIRDDLTGDTLATYAQSHPQRTGSVCEMIIVKVHQLDTVVCVLYRPPDTRGEEFACVLKCLDSTLSSLPSPTPNILVMGDFNFPQTCIKWKQCSEEGLLVPLVAGHRDGETSGGKQDRLQAQRLVDLATKHCLLQQVDTPTHGVEVLDLIFSNSCELLNSVEVEKFEKFSDHSLVVANTAYKHNQGEQQLEQQYLCDTGKRYSALNFHKAPWAEIKEELAKVDWKNMEEVAKSCPSSALIEFHSKVLGVLEHLVPIKSKKSSGRPKMDRKRRLLWRRLTKVRKKFKTASTISKVTECMQLMWELESQLSEDYKATNIQEEDEAVFRIKSNSKAFFSFARSRQKIKAKVGPFLDPKTGFPNASPAFAAEELCKQYNSVFAQPRQAWNVGTDKFKEHFGIVDGNNILSDIKFNPEDIEKACEELKGTSAPGPDGVPAILLKSCKKELSKPLYTLWRASLDTGVIPVELLLVLVCPVHKGGSRSVPKNYRPVALTSHLIKIFERVVRKVLVKHIEDLGLLPEGQHGSRSMRSTLTQLLAHWDSILEGLENGLGVDAVYLDFSKAFDKVETGVLLHKLRDSKVLGKVGCWLAAFLDSTNRKQAVVVEGRLSSLSPVISGVPQGTVLGPVLFLIHIADIARGVSPGTSTTSYVDDTRASRSIVDIQGDSQVLQQDLDSIYSWAKDVNMEFNSEKFECLRYWPGGQKPDLTYTSPDGKIIEERPHLRDLGVEMSSDLTFRVHIEKTVTAANRLVGWALRSFRRRSKLVMLTIWKSLIQSKLDYTSQLWSPSDQTSIGKLESVARNFTSMIHGLEGMDYWERLESLHLFSQERRRERYRIIFLWKVAQGLVKGYNSTFSTSPRRGRVMVVSPLINRGPASLRKAKESSLQVRGAQLFNILPRALRDIMTGTPEQFKKQLDDWLSSIPDQPTIPGRQRAASSNSLLDQVPLVAGNWELT